MCIFLRNADLEEEHMSRLISSFTFALVATALTAHAQETTVKSKTRSTGGEVQTVTYTGCVQTGTQSKTFVLDKVVPKTRTTTTVLQTGQTSTSTTYVLVPGTVQVQEHVGKKVEVTGTLIPGGDTRTETSTRVERDGAPDTKTRERVETRNAMPEFRVTAIKDLGERCQ
jgi:hypothetical protein